ncbi:hypothetical protein L1987_47105 [Smallanthus sonchifolius]|uniref:Uncharacterized protein n=1 Tax=Smallanthus sonchifolius TaxID=185202 RepID=A0ACB9G257_9ASTR|nr:hypothetical protein L1987_47105 [Smallanthus sonchifolius]
MRLSNGVNFATGWNQLKVEEAKDVQKSSCTFEVGGKIYSMRVYSVHAKTLKFSDQEIKSAYCKLALKCHPDKNANDRKVSDMFTEITFASNISNLRKRHHYHTAGFEAAEKEGQELELDLSSLGAMNTMFAAIFSKLKVPTQFATLLGEALKGGVTIEPIALGLWF